MHRRLAAGLRASAGGAGAWHLGGLGAEIDRLGWQSAPGGSASSGAAGASLWAACCASRSIGSAVDHAGWQGRGRRRSGVFDPRRRRLPETAIAARRPRRARWARPCLSSLSLVATARVPPVTWARQAQGFDVVCAWRRRRPRGCADPAISASRPRRSSRYRHRRCRRRRRSARCRVCPCGGRGLGGVA